MRTLGARNTYMTRIPNIKTRMATKGVTIDKLAAQAGVCRQVINFARAGQAVSLTLAGYIVVALEKIR